MKTILVTGAAGFAGSHFIEHALNITDWNIIGIYSLRHRGDVLRMPVNNRFKPMFHDLNGPFSERQKHLLGEIDYIVNMAAESHVERSISEPVPFVRNNIESVMTMLELARFLKPKVFVQISTDEVYGPAVGNDKHQEWREIIPSNPYAASKAAQEAMAISYWRTYELPLIITNTMNMCGPRQDAEKFIPMCIRKIHRGESVSIHGDSSGRSGARQYLHAKNHADAIIYLLNKDIPTFYDSDHEISQRPDRYNIVGEEEINNLNMAQLIAELMDKPLIYNFMNFHQARPGHDRRYALDGSKMKNIGWTAPISLRDTLKETIDFTLAHPEWME